MLLTIVPLRLASLRNHRKPGLTLENTNHLSHSELYILLVSDLLLEPTTLISRQIGWPQHIIPIDSDTEEDMVIYRPYCDSEVARTTLQMHYPGMKTRAQEIGPSEIVIHVSPPQEILLNLSQPTSSVVLLFTRRFGTARMGPLEISINAKTCI